MKLLGAGIPNFEINLFPFGKIYGVAKDKARADLT
jgi:hypothetical protein